VARLEELLMKNNMDNFNCLYNGFPKEDIKACLAQKEIERMNKVKQVIVMRKEFLLPDGKTVKVRRGKEIAQGSHGSMAVILNEMRKIPQSLFARFMLWIIGKCGYKTLFFAYKKESFWDIWLNGRFTKVCVYCKDEAELLEIYKKAQDANIPSVLITDAGLTEFNNVPTRTCVGIGPFWATEIDKITGSLPLL